MPQPRQGSIVATFCHDCGMELRKPSDLMRHTCPIALARQARLSDDPLRIAPPHRLYALSGGDGDRYRHALEEAGHVISKATGEPFDPCRICGWSPS